jgi:hypothetical protein
MPPPGPLDMYGPRINAHNRPSSENLANPAFGDQGSRNEIDVPAMQRRAGLEYSTYPPLVRIPPTDVSEVKLPTVGVVKKPARGT